jgi:HPt (histidine-containing phosphotransfer) domain-containing protein
MTGFVARPIRKETLLAALLEAPGKYAVPGASRVPAGTESDHSVNALDRSAFARLTEEIGADGVAELVAVFEEETHARLMSIAGHGLDRDQQLREMHGLKGAAAAACAMLLSSRAAAIEQHLKSDGYDRRRRRAAD